MLERLAKLAAVLVASMGYWGLTLGLVIDSMGVPVPSEILIPVAAALTRQGQFNLAAVVVVATLAQTAGAVAAYWIGRKGGLPLLEKYGKYFLLSRRDLNIAHRWFERYGVGITLAGRCLPVIRGYVAYPAGVTEMNFGLFLGASFFGSLAWTVILAVLGYQLGGHLDAIAAGFHRFSLVIVGLLLLGLVWYIKAHAVKKEKK